MSSYTVEAFLHDLANKAGVKERFVADPDGVFADYPLTGEERQRLRDWNVRAMNEAGVSPMLLILSYMTMHGPNGATDYLLRMGLSESGAALATH